MKNIEKIPAQGWSAFGEKNTKGGFIQLIVIIIVVLFLMYYFKIDVIKVLDYIRNSFIDIANWFKNLFGGAR
ncbi:hypothetical protein A3H53_02595 [Candidatus Nomurabacteria bacterium RIFCSPLOWO2_02_FULL_40_10]|uniref:Uncharacterized protein n=2 Tax=Candidatus Nomuraibacteriota TaxID=1752729 RepID=A0A1F6Y0K1_9BACT|nr:MAG: hypothetical protein A2642_04210 [Candidatus Nomurabacteria bacterium RIFCSPHIGHO2_01_FULL_39_10]OGI99893.1 MAG: hypothetical protein A3H53_02595 [Candidatus Nomurabacteria bacterium RIFCSPLOWO2_02_FULL_40_10]